MDAGGRCLNLELYIVTHPSLGSFYEYPGSKHDPRVRRAKALPTALW